MNTLYSTNAAEVLAARLGQEVVTVEDGIRLRVNGKGYGKASDRDMDEDVFLAAVLDETLQPAEVTLTMDGRAAFTSEWHQGPETDWVFVERWTPLGRVFHGWVDSASRRLLQAG